jgi:hypothetical protein
MGRVGFRVRKRRYAFLLVGARSGAGVDGANTTPKTSMRHFWRIPRQLLHRVPDLSAYATKMRVPLLRADLLLQHPNSSVMRHIGSPGTVKLTGSGLGGAGLVR